MIDSSAEIGKLMRRKRMKSNLVSSGTMRSRRMDYFSLRMVLSDLPSPAEAGVAKAGTRFPLFGIMRLPLNRNALRATPPDPIGDDQSCHGKGGEHGGDDADAERDGKAAHRAGADIEQHRGGDEGGDIGIENGGERTAESGIDRVDRRAAAAP